MELLFMTGTTIVALRTNDAILIGSDSKVIAVGDQVTDGGATPKVAQMADMTIAHAGFFKDTAGSFDVRATAQTARSAGGSLSETASFFESLVVGPLRNTLEQLEAINPAYFAAECQGKTALSILFAGIENAIPKLATRTFTAEKDANGLIDFRIHRLDCPGDCPDGTAFTSLGYNTSLNAYLDSHPDTRVGVPLFNTLIQLEIDNNPTMVGPPIRILLIRCEGSEWIQ